MKKLIHKIKCFLKKLLGKKCCGQACTKAPEVVEPTPAPEAPKEEPKAEEPKAPEAKEEVEPGKEEPAESKPESAKIQSFLWKPVSDTTGNVVILVGCDAIRSEDLKCEILNKEGNKIRVDIRNTGRGNQLPTQKFGRVHFRVDRTAKKFEKAAPLTVQIYHTLGGKKVVLGKVRIKDPNRRLEK